MKLAPALLNDLDRILGRQDHVRRVIRLVVHVGNLAVELFVERVHVAIVSHPDGIRVVLVSGQLSLDEMRILRAQRAELVQEFLQPHTESSANLN